jgi:hypothetical protein
VKLTRRALVQGLAATGLALPALEALSSRGSLAAQSPTAPKRFVMMYAGVSTGTDAADAPRLTPGTNGAGYELPRGLLPLGTAPTAWGAPGQDVHSDVSIVSGMTVPWAESVGATPPPGGRSREFHYNTVGPQISGMRGGNERTGEARGPSADQIAADVLAGDRPHRSLSYRVQAARYVGDNSVNGGQLSYRRDGSGRLSGIDPIGSPRLAYSSLFSGFEPPDPIDRDRQLLGMRSRRGVLALTQERTRSLVSRLGAADRQRLEQHLDELSALERRLAAVPPPGSDICVVPSEPVDPAIGIPHNTDGDGNLAYLASAGYSDEQLRAETMCDLVHMAFACDVTRVAAVRLTHDQSFLNMRQATGVEADAHGTTHGGGGITGSEDMLAWHVWHFARLVRKIRDTRELDGSSMLDHTAVVLLFEGGFGYDPEGDADGSAHSTENMIALVAGRVGGLVAGQHIVATDAHPAQVLISALSALGVAEELGEISGGIPGLIG